MKHLILITISFLSLKLSAQSEIESTSSEVVKVKSTTGVTTTITLENDGDLPAGGAINNRRGYLETRANDVIVGASSNNTGGDIILKLPATSLGRIMLANNTANHVVMRSNGDLGIGTDTPSKKLDVDGEVRIRNLPDAGATDSYVTADADGNLRVKSSSTPTYAIGDFAQGGVVFWVSPSGKHGKVVSIYNIDFIPWSNISNIEIGTSAQSDINGAGNTVAIILQDGHTVSAGEHCKRLAYAGYDDWYLPSKNELNEIYINRTTINSVASANGGEDFLINFYWSSTEFDTTTAWGQVFLDGSQSNGLKHLNGRVRAIRAF